jgi:nitrite reductase (NADH) large subunit
MKLAVSGCPRNCAEATVKDIGAVAVENGWQVYVGGAAGSTVRAADLLATMPTREEVMTLMGRFMQYYRENGRYAERSYAFVQRLGIERLRAILVDDSEGEAARLDGEIEAAVAAYHDPWLERDHPHEPTQFADARVVGAESIGVSQ